MPSRYKLLSVTFLEDTPVGGTWFATGTTISLADDVARGLGRAVRINGAGNAAAVPGMNPIVVSASAPSNGDGMPDGTIYLQV